MEESAASSASCDVVTIFRFPVVMRVLCVGAVRAVQFTANHRVQHLRRDVGVVGPLDGIGLSVDSELADEFTVSAGLENGAASRHVGKVRVRVISEGEVHTVAINSYCREEHGVTLGLSRGRGSACPTDPNVNVETSRGEHIDQGVNTEQVNFPADEI